MSDIKAVLFDYDGVLTLDKTGIESACKYISKYANIDFHYFEREYRKFWWNLIHGKTTHELIWNQLCSNLHKEIPIAVLYHSFNQTPIDEDMHDLVLKIKNANLKTALITCNFSDRIAFVKKKFNLEKYFDTFAVSAELGFGKEAEKTFTDTLNTLGVLPEESIFIDDKEENLYIPKKLGINVIYFDDSKRNINKLIACIQEYGITLN